MKTSELGFEARLGGESWKSILIKSTVFFLGSELPGQLRTLHESSNSFGCRQSGEAMVHHRSVGLEIGLVYFGQLPAEFQCQGHLSPHKHPKTFKITRPNSFFSSGLAGLCPGRR